MKKRIFVDGYFTGNLGDDLFLYILLKRYPKIIMYTFAKKELYKQFNKYGNLRIFNTNNRIYNYLYNKRKKSDKKGIVSKLFTANVLIGGSLFAENKTSVKDLLNRHNEMDYYILGANIGPFFSDTYLDTIRKIFNESQDVCLRDRKSYHLVSSIPKVRYAPDMVFGLDIIKPCLEEKQIIISVIDLEYKGFSEGQINYYNLILDNIIRKYYNMNYIIKIASFCSREKDIEAVSEIQRKFPFTQKVEYSGNIHEVLDEFAKSEVVVATRFHALVLGLLLEKVVVPIVYDIKMTNLLEDIGFSNKYYDLLKLCESIGNGEYNFPDVTSLKLDSENHFKKLDLLLLY